MAKATKKIGAATRGRAHGSADKRAAILEAAADIFLQGGYLGASMDDIAAAAGVAKQTVYSYFPNKKSLFAEMVSAISHQASDRVHDESPEFHGEGDVATYLADYARRQLAVVLTPRILQLRRLVIGEVARFPELGSALYAGGPGRAIATLAAILEQLAAAKILRIDDPLLAATQFNWLIMSAPLNRTMLLGDQAIPSEAELQKHILDGIRMFMASYAAS